VQVARDAGMKYIVLTSKHHDGFAMFRSKASSFNIVDATPFKTREHLKAIGANYLLNVGPDGLGRLPAQAVANLLAAK